MAGLVSDDDLSDNKSDCSEHDGQIEGTNEKRLKVKMEDESKGEISPIDENEEWAKVKSVNVQNRGRSVDPQNGPRSNKNFKRKKSQSSYTYFF